VSQVLTGTIVNRIARDGDRFSVTGDPGLDGALALVLVVVGVRPDTTLAETAGLTFGDAAVKGASVVDDHMRAGVPNMFAAGHCVQTVTGGCRSRRSSR
jgi:NAD(P)H-nitrite reductase large subunit